MAKVMLNAQGEMPQTEKPSIFDWLKNEPMKANNLWLTQQSQDDLIRELMARQDRQGKWIVFLLISWLFTCAFVWFGVLVV